MKDPRAIEILPRGRVNQHRVRKISADRVEPFLAGLGEAASASHNMSICSQSLGILVVMSV